jgi:hypothetical protein
MLNFGGEFCMAGIYIHDNRLQVENHRLKELLKKIQAEEYYSNLTKLHEEEVAKYTRKIDKLSKRDLKLSEQQKVDTNKIKNLKEKLNDSNLIIKNYKIQLREKEKEASAFRKQTDSLYRTIQKQYATQEELIEREIAKNTNMLKEEFLKKGLSLQAEFAHRESLLQAELSDKEGMIQKLTGQINRDFKNSSIPSSQCMGHETIHNGREKTGRKPGGQPGHKGHHRTAHIATSHIILTAPCACNSCASKNLKPTGKSKTRQQVDLKVVVTATDIISEEYYCEECGANFYTEYPLGLVNEVNYGPEVKSLASFLNNYCNVSLDKTAETLSEITGGVLNLSKGTLNNLSKDFSNRVSTTIEEIINDIRQSPIINTDSSNGRESGKNVFFHVFANSTNRIYLANAHKGIAALTGSPIDDYVGILVHDHDRSYYHFGKDHQECNVHVLRYLKDVIENEPKLIWHKQMYELLLEMNNTRKGLIKEGKMCFSPEKIADFHKKYDEILETASKEYLQYPPNKYIFKGFNLARRLRSFKQNHLLFLENLDIPFDNNLSERSVRVAKRKMKTIGTFRSMKQGMQRYCDFLTITETSKSRGFRVYQILKNVFNGEKDIWFELT